MPGIAGIGPDAPVVVNERGGRQSAIPVRFTLVPAEAMFRVARVFTYGAGKHGADNWRNIDARDHLDHLLLHLHAYLIGDTQDDHLGHALCRLMMMVAQERPETQAELCRHVNTWAAEWHPPARKPRAGEEALKEGWD